MKRFHELSPSQQEEAIEYALSELKECVKMGIIEEDSRNPLSEEFLRSCAEAGAESAYYAEKGERMVYNIADGK